MFNYHPLSLFDHAHLRFKILYLTHMTHFTTMLLIYCQSCNIEK
jgi:hypothetical protein